MSRPTAGESAPATKSAPKSARLLSLDAYRGFTMLAMASGGLGLKLVADRNSHWRTIADQSDHRLWEGCTFWDLIQPSFMFIVGVSMVMSYAARSGQGQSWPRQCLHAVKRAALLCLIGMFLDWYDADSLYIQFIRVLQQIAIGYLIAFAVLPLGSKVQAVTILFLLAGHTAAYLIYGHFHELTFNGVPDAWHGFVFDPSRPGAYEIDKLNFGQRLDVLIGVPLSVGRYVTFNAISSAATILMGVLVGDFLRGPGTHSRKLGLLAGAGAACLLVGWLLSGADYWIWSGSGISGEWKQLVTPAVPMVKRIWTASFAIFAAGWTCWMLAFFYAVIEGLGFKSWAFPCVVVGMNSIAMYVIAHVLKFNVKKIADLIVPPFVSAHDPNFESKLAKIRTQRRLCDLIPVVDFSNWSVHFGIDLSTWYLTPLIESCLMLTFFWLACYWLYRKQIFFKV